MVLILVGLPATGLVTALTLGDAVITATATDANLVSASYKVTITDGKVAHYAFNGNLDDSFQLVEPGRAIGNTANSVTVGNITYGEGMVGQAALFDGLSGIRLPDGLIDSNTYSVSMWLHPERLTNFTTTFFGAYSPQSWISFVPHTDNGVTRLWSGEAWYDANSSVKIPQDVWTHVTFTVNNGKVKIYIDGVETFNSEGFPNIFKNKNGVFALGVNYWNDDPYKGLIDELKVYSRELKAEEVLAEFNIQEN